MVIIIKFEVYRNPLRKIDFSSLNDGVFILPKTACGEVFCRDLDKVDKDIESEAMD